MIFALLLVWIAFTAFAVSGLAWLEPRHSRKDAAPSALEPTRPEPAAAAHDPISPNGRDLDGADRRAGEAPTPPPVISFG